MSIWIGSCGCYPIPIELLDNLKFNKDGDIDKRTAKYKILKLWGMEQDEKEKLTW